MSSIVMLSTFRGCEQKSFHWLSAPSLFIILSKRPTCVYEIIKWSNIEIPHSALGLLGESDFIGELKEAQFCCRYVDY